MDEQAADRRELDLGSVQAVRRIVENLAIVVRAPAETLRLAVLCLLAEGHLIIEDFPGVGKTTLAKALALAGGREYVVPDDVKAVAPSVLAHRLILAPEARATGTTSEDVVREAIERTPVPV